MTRYTVDGEYIADSRRDRKLNRQRGRIRRVEDSDIEQLIEAGDCPWCDDYSGEHVGQHASATHPEEWERYNEQFRHAE